MIPVHYTTGEAAKISRRHIVTIRLDLEDGTLHGSHGYRVAAG